VMVVVVMVVVVRVCVCQEWMDGWRATLSPFLSLSLPPSLSLSLSLSLARARERTYAKKESGSAATVKSARGDPHVSFNEECVAS
jgi:hypothetical protein